MCNLKYVENFLCVACPAKPKFPSFSTFREVCAHSLQVHGVVLEAAVQSATVLPDKLAMFLCLLCSADKREFLISEASMKHHLESHSSFFLRNWKEYVEIQCRICECIVSLVTLEEHVKEHHPRNLFANVNSVNQEVEDVPKSEGPDGTSVSSLEYNISHFMPETEASSGMKEIKSCLDSQPGSEEAKLLWDHSFKPDQLISKYFTKLLPAKLNKEDLTTPDLENSKQCLRIKPLCLLQEKAEQPASTSHVESSLSSRSLSSRTRPVSPCSTLGSNESLSIAASRKRSRSLSSSVDKELPPSRTWWSNKQTKNFETKADCFVCGLHIDKNRLCFHIQYYHMDMLFRCMMNPCRTKRVFFKKSTFLFPGQLHRHHKQHHKVFNTNVLDISPTMTGLPSSLVKISCSNCPKLSLSSDKRIILKHVELEHRDMDTRACLLFNCRVCNQPFNSVEEVVEHGKSHIRMNQSHTEMRESSHWYRGRIRTQRRSRSRDSSLTSHIDSRRMRLRNKSRSRGEHSHYHTKEGRWRTFTDVGGQSRRSNSRLYSDRSRSISRSVRDFSRRSCSRKSRRPTRSRSRSTVSSVR